MKKINKRVTASTRKDWKQYESANRDRALELARAGFHVFPCHYKDGDKCSCGKAECRDLAKHPANGRGGCLDATRDEHQINRFWFSAIRRNIGIACGHEWPSAAGEFRYLVVVDIDVAGDKTGQQSLDALTAAHGPLPETLRARTGSGGTHYYFLTRVAVGNVKGDTADKPLGLNIDVRGRGGYVLAPPSNHRSGNCYEWENWGTPIAPMPEWMEARLTKGEVMQREESTELPALALPAEFTADDLPLELTEEELQVALDAIPAEEIDAYEAATTNPGCWWAVGAALKRRGDAGFNLWYEWSKRAPKYKSQYSATKKALREWEASLDKFWKDFKPGRWTDGTILHYAKKNAKYKLPDRIAQAQAEAVEKKAAAAVEQVKKLNWLYCIASREFYQENPFQRLSKDQFSDKFAYLRAKSKSFADQCLANPEFPRVDCYTFDPRTEKRFVEEDGLSKLNLYRPSIVVAQPGEVRRFIKHAEYILPDETQRRLLLQYMAFNVRHPGEKIRWALILYGRIQRTGKSYFGQVLKRIVGQHNVATPTNERLHEAWTDWQEGVQLVIVEEVKGLSRIELMNRLKPMITEDTTSVRLPGGRSYEMPNRYNFIMFTNHKDALPFEETDKRYCVLETKAERMPDLYYDGVGDEAGLWGWSWANLPAIKAYLWDYSLVGFKPHGEAPITSLFREIVERGGSMLDEWVQDGIESKTGLFACDLVVVKDLLQVMPEYLSKRGIKRNLMATALEKAGARQLPHRAQLGGLGECRIWSVRNHDDWIGQSEGTLGSTYLNFLRAGSGQWTPQMLNDVLDEHRRKGQALDAMVKETAKPPM